MVRLLLAHPQLVAGAWVGFNDGRITLRSDYWGQGAHSALPIVGEFFQQALRSRLIDAKARFTPPEDKGMMNSLLQRIHGWLPEIFPAESAPQATPMRPAPPPESSPPVTEMAAQSAPVSESASAPAAASQSSVEAIPTIAQSGITSSNSVPTTSQSGIP